MGHAIADGVENRLMSIETSSNKSSALGWEALGSGQRMATVVGSMPIPHAEFIDISSVVIAPISIRCEADHFAKQVVFVGTSAIKPSK